MFPATSPSLLHVAYQKGIHVPDADLWLDPMQPKPWAFISHAHADHVARHQNFIASHNTLQILKTRYGLSASTNAIALDYHEPHERDGYLYTLLPAGHILGSAMLHLRRIADGKSLLYTGDFQLKANVTAEKAECMQADTLILETTFGLSRYQFPPLDQTLLQLRQFIEDLHEHGSLPVLLAYSLGKAQEVMYALKDFGYHFHVHQSIDSMNAIYREKYSDFPESTVYQNQRSLHQIPKSVLLVPPSAARSASFKKLKRARFAMLSGWALDAGATFRYQVDEAFPWSDHADYTELLETVKNVNPQRIYTVHGFTREFASDLRERGYDASSLLTDDQLNLGLDLSEMRPEDSLSQHQAAKREIPDVASSPTSFFAWCDMVESLLSELSRAKKVELAKNFLGNLSDDKDVYRAILWLSGHIEPLESTQEILSSAILKRVLMEMSGLHSSQFQNLLRTHHGLGATSFLVLEPILMPRFKDRKKTLTLEKVESFFTSLHESKGSLTQLGLLKTFLEELHPLEASYVIRLLSGELQGGSREGILQEAVASTFEVDLHSLREAAMLLGNLSQAAVEARNKRLAAISPTPFVPFKPMLASSENSAEALHAHFQAPLKNDENSPEEKQVHPSHHSEPIWLEDKFDGIRIQLHRTKSEVQIYTHDLKQVTHLFPDLAKSAAKLKDEVILDGEVLVHCSTQGTKLTFQNLLKRFHQSHHEDLFMTSEVSTKYVVFDILWKNHINLLKLPLRERRQQLEETPLSTGIQKIAVWEAESPEEIEAAFQSARRAGNEGIIAKDPSSHYECGKRSASWLKLKKEFSTLDVVVVKAEQGNLSHDTTDYTFAVRDEHSGSLKIIGKTHAGLSPEETEQLAEQFKTEVPPHKGKAKKTKPRVILEVAFDAIKVSKQNDSGLALQGPRIKAIRHDKGLQEIDTLRYVKQLAGIAV